MPKFAFDSKTREYSGQNAYWLARASKLAYKDATAIQNEIASDWGIEEFDLKIFEIKDTFAFLLKTPETIIIAFRGTNSFVDWLDNINIELVAGPEGKVHEGFYTALNCIWVDLYRYLQTKRETHTLWLTGHSLGGALATLAAAKLRLERDEVVRGLYTFGQPRTGNREFARRFDIDFVKQTFRHVNDVDIVPRIPFRSMGYSHIGTFKFFNGKGDLDDDVNWFDLIIERMKARIEDLLEPETAGIKAHDMNNYITNLAKILPQS